MLHTVTYSELMRPCSSIHAWHSCAQPVTHVSWSRWRSNPAANPGTVVPLQLSEAERTEQYVHTHNPQVLPDNTYHCVKGSEISLGLAVRVLECKCWSDQWHQVHVTHLSGPRVLVQHAGSNGGLEPKPTHSDSHSPSGVAWLLCCFKHQPPKPLPKSYYHCIITYTFV